MSDEESAGRVVSELLEKLARQDEELREARRLLKKCDWVLPVGVDPEQVIIEEITAFLARPSRFEK